jgi:predicted nucleic acid-binding protein
LKFTLVHAVAGPGRLRATRPVIFAWLARAARLCYFPHLTLADVTRDVARRAAQLRARYGLRPADALHVATALVHAATAFVTNDRQLTRLAPLLDIIVLEDYAEL